MWFSGWLQSGEYQNVDPNFVVTFFGANHTPSGGKVVKMNQTYKIGPSKSVKVYPGDKIDMEVWEYHEGASGFGTSSTTGAALINMVSGVFGGMSGGGGEVGAIYDGVESAILNFGAGGNQGTGRPAAYLNFILFDRNYNVLDAGWQLVPETTFTKQKVTIPTLDIKEEGYVFVYLSYDNDSPNWVYFDDFKVTHTKSNVIQYNEYYPFGMQTSSSWTRDGSNNNFLYNSGSELNVSTGNYEMFFRSYDPAIGRMYQIDPLAASYHSESPYHYSLNNPVFFNDPNGASVASPMDKYWADLFASEGIISSASEPGGSGSGRGGIQDFLRRHLKFKVTGTSGFGSDGSSTATGHWVVTSEGTWTSPNSEFGYSFNVWNNNNGGYHEGDGYRTYGSSGQGQQGKPVIFISFSATPKDFNKADYFSQLTSALIANGFNRSVQVKEYSFTEEFKAWWNNSPTGLVSFRYARPDDPGDAGGVANLNQTNSIVVFPGLNGIYQQGSIPIWAYVNATLHEIGHAFFGFTHDAMGNTLGPPSIMDYKYAYDKGRGFNLDQHLTVINSAWGNP